MSLLDAFGRSLQSAAVNRTLTKCSRWANKRRIMGGDFPGPYSWKFHPWVRDLHDSTASYSWFMKGAQLGVTEVAINRAFYTLLEKRRNVLYVLPTTNNANRFSKGRFATALKHSPFLAQAFTDTNSVLLKQAGTSTLYISGSRGDSNLKSIDVSEMILDEMDEMDQKQIWLAIERLSGQLYSKSITGISTPTFPNHGIHDQFLLGTQEHYVFKCPRCGRRTELTWPDSFELCGESPYDPDTKKSYLKCKECKKKLLQEEKPEFLSADKAKWTPLAEGCDPDNRSFYINQLYSFTVQANDIAVAFHRGQRDEAAAKEFNNSKLGLPFVAEGAKVTVEQVQDAQDRGGYSMEDAMPRDGSSVITLGVDQGKWNYWVAIQWFLNGPMGLDMNASAFARVIGIGKFFETDWHHLWELMRVWQVWHCVIDADPQINEARRFARDFPKYVSLCRYRRGKVGREISVMDDEAGAPLATVDRTNWLTASLGRFRFGTIALPTDTPTDFKDHVQALVRTYEEDEDGNPVATFKSTGPDHYGHALNYGEIALPLAASIKTGQNVEKFL